MDDRENVRARALRAARVVTLGLAIASVPACGGRTHMADEDSGVPGTDAALADSGPVDLEDSGAEADSGVLAPDGGPDADGGWVHDGGAGDSGVLSDAGVLTDAGALADAGTDVDAGPGCPDVFPPPTRECCEATPGGHWDEASMMCWVAVPGPFVPPAETAHV